MSYPDHTSRFFRDFNFCAIWDPNLRGGPSFEALFRLVYEAREGDRSGSVEFGDTMYCTLRPAAFEAYQRAHGPVAITYSEWFYAKVKMFFEVLLYHRLEVNELTADQNIAIRVVEQPWKEGIKGFFHHGDWIDDDEIGQMLIPEDNEGLSWAWLAHEVSAVKANRIELLRAILKHQSVSRNASARKPATWGRNRERDRVILNCFERGMERPDICKELDLSKIPIQPSLRKHGFSRWTDAWQDMVARQTIQQLFTKRLRTVKFRMLSK